MMRMNVHIRVPAPGNTQRIDANLPCQPVAIAHRDCCQAKSARCVDHLFALAAVNDRNDVDPLCRQISGGAQAVVVVGEDRNPLADRDTPAIGIGAQGPCQHDAGPVVVLEGDGPLGRAAAQDRALRIDPPQHLPRLALRGHSQMVRYPFDRAIDAVVKGADHRGPGHQAHAGQGRKFGHGGTYPVSPRGPADCKVLGIQPAAKTEILVRKDHPFARPTSGQRRHQARRARPDDQKITVQEPLVIGIRVFVPGHRTKTGRTADDRLINLFPEGLGPHEGLVIEPGCKEGRQLVVDPHGVETKAGPTVLAVGLKAVEQFGHRGPRVRFLSPAGPQLDQGVRLFRARAQGATGAMVLEAATHQPNAVGKQRRGQRVAGMARVGQPVEGEAERPGAVDLAAPKLGVDAMRLAHFVRPCLRATSRASSTRVISCVTVFRVTTSQERSPCSWYQSSRCSPAGLVRL